MANRCERKYKGWIQILIVHSRQPIRFVQDLGAWRAVSAATLIAGSIVGALFWPAFAVGTIWRALSAGSGVLSASREAGDVFTYILALFGVWSIVIPAVVVARQRDLDVSLKELALLPAYYLLVTVSAWIAIFDLIVRPHYWAKTAHGRRPQRLPRNLFLKPGAS